MAESSSRRTATTANRSLNDQLESGGGGGGGTATAGDAAAGGGGTTQQGKTVSSPPGRSGSLRNREKKTNDLDCMSSRRDSNGRSIPAWKLREQMKLDSMGSRHGSRHGSSIHARTSGTTAAPTSASAAAAPPPQLAGREIGGVGGGNVSSISSRFGGSAMNNRYNTFNKPSPPSSSHHSNSSSFRPSEIAVSSVPSALKSSSATARGGTKSISASSHSGSSGGGGGLGITRHGLRKSTDIDPSLPPAFRAAFTRQQQRKRQNANDEFMSLDSVHSGKSRGSSYMAGSTTPTTTRLNDDDDDDGDSFGDGGSSIGSESLDGHDSFASLGEDSDDDEAYRESKNMLARQEIEQQRKSSLSSSLAPGSKSRIKRGTAKGVHGAPLDFIAE